MVSKTDWILFLFLSCNICLTFNFVNAQDNSTISCFSCEGSDECAEKQIEGNSTTEMCSANQHCWVMSYEEKNGTVLYRRGCDDTCTEESRKVDCKTIVNRKFCSICCSEKLCNSGDPNAAFSPGLNKALLPLSFVSMLWVVWVSESLK